MKEAVGDVISELPGGYEPQGKASQSSTYSGEMKRPISQPEMLSRM